MAKKSQDLPRRKGTPPLSKQAMYSKIASRGAELIEKLFRETDSSNPSVRIAALRTLIDKVLPNLKATELTGKDGQPLIEISWKHVE